MKKLLYFSIFFLLTLVYPTGMDASTGNLGNSVFYTWNTDNKTVTIYGSGDIEDFYFSSPFSWSDIETVIIQNGITRIGNQTFRQCFSLVSIEIPSSVKSIGEWAFENSL